MDIDDEVGPSEFAAQAIIVFVQFPDVPGFGQGRVAFAPALLGSQRDALGGLALLAPGGEIRGVDPLATQQGPDLARLRAAIRSGQDAAFLAAREASPFRGGGHFRVGRGRRREGGRVSSRPTGSFQRVLPHNIFKTFHRCFHLAIHDSNPPFYSKYTKEGVSCHIGTGGDWCTQLRYVPYKKTTHVVVPYLDKPEIDALLACTDQRTAQGRRDHALLLFLYNSGARADEAAHLTIGNVDSISSSVSIMGKGRKQRQCPLWPDTVRELYSLAAQRPPQERVFLNRCGQPLTRFGIHAVVERYALKAQVGTPSLATKRVSPHSIRHSTATHLLRAGVDINTVRAWLGHVSLDTTNVYAEIDLETKALALAKCDIAGNHKASRRWAKNPELLAFLRSL